MDACTPRVGCPLGPVDRMPALRCHDTNDRLSSDSQTCAELWIIRGTHCDVYSLVGRRVCTRALLWLCVIRMHVLCGEGRGPRRARKYSGFSTAGSLSDTLNRK